MPELNHSIYFWYSLNFFLGQRLIQTQQNQKDYIGRLFNSLNSLSVSTPSKQRHLQETISSLISIQQHTKNAFSEILPIALSTHLVTMIWDMMYSRLCKEILSLRDIPADESHILHDTIQPLLTPSSSVSYKKLRVIVDILVMSFAEIMDGIRGGVIGPRNGFLHDGREVCWLIKALFADTPLRAKNLDEVMRTFHQ
jgi:hypothetical protein